MAITYLNIEHRTYHIQRGHCVIIIVALITLQYGVEGLSNTFIVYLVLFRESVLGPGPRI